MLETILGMLFVYAAGGWIVFLIGMAVSKNGRSK